MPRSSRVGETIYTTRKHALVWVLIWVILLLTTWFSRPLIPFQETSLAAMAWEMYQSGEWLMPQLNGAFVIGEQPLIQWLEVAIWHLFGVSEFSLRALSAFISFGTLLLTASAAYQLWPHRRDIRANAPLILIGSLMWTVFATAHIEEIYLTFFLLLSTVTLIRIWRYEEGRWWPLYALFVLLGLFTSGLISLFYLLPLLLTVKFWHREGSVGTFLLSGAISLFFALLVFLLWAWFSQFSLNLDASLWSIMGGGRLIDQFTHARPLYLYLLNTFLILFPWVLWPSLYRYYRECEQDAPFRFVLSWFWSSLLIAIITNNGSLLAFYTLFPPLSLVIARIYQKRSSRMLDLLGISIAMILIGLVLILIPLNYQLFNLPEWVGQISPLWGGGLLLFSMTLLFSAGETRLLTLSLLSVALILALNFAVVRQATDFYDLTPSSERIAWYQSREITVAHDGRYLGHFHFAGRLSKPLAILYDEEDYRALQDRDAEARVVLYLSEIEPYQSVLEYWQPFRGRYLAIIPIESVIEHIWNAEKEKDL